METRSLTLLSFSLLMMVTITVRLDAQTPQQREIAELFQRAESLRSAGKLREALALHQQGLPLLNRLFGPTHNVTAAGLNDLGLLHMELGEYAAAEPLITKAVEIWEANRGRQHESVARGVSNLGIVYRELGQYFKAEACFRSAQKVKVALFGADHVESAIDTYHLGTLHLAMGASKEAEEFYRRALDVFERKLDKNHSHIGNGLEGLVDALIDLKRFQEAEPLQRRCLEIRQTTVGKDHSLYAKALFNFALIYESTGRYQEAEELYLQSHKIKVATFGPDHPTVALSHYNLAGNYARMSDWKRAAESFDRSRRTYRKHQAAILPSLGQREQLAFLEENDKGRLHAALGMAVAHPNEANLTALSGNWLLNSKGLAHETFAQRHRDNRKPAPAVTATDPWMETKVIAQEVPQDGIFIDFARFWRFKDDSATDERYAAWLTSGGASSTTQLVDLGDAGKIDLAVRGVLDALEAAPRMIAEKGEVEAEKAMHDSLDKLSKIVLHPLLSTISDKQTWIISPDAVLWLVPWSALRLNDGSYAVKNHTIRCLLHGRDLLPVSATTQATNPPAIFADPDFNLSPDEQSAETKKLVRTPPPETTRSGVSAAIENVQWTRLPGTATEAQVVQTDVEKYTGAPPRVFTDRYALEGVVKAYASPQVLILSTHGFFLPDPEVSLDVAGFSRPRFRAGIDESLVENPLLRCGVALAGANKRAKSSSGDDGLLTGAEVGRLDLRGCKLVVLSACETGLGEVRAGDGVAGLRQAFQTAGAQTVAASLWKVPDTATTLLMAGFFGHLSGGKNAAEALCLAQRDQIARRTERYAAAHPYYWAAFTVTGRETAKR